MSAVVLSEFAICERRGHEHSGNGITEGMGPTWGYCKWCNVRFRHTEPSLVIHPEDVDRLELLES